MQISTRPYWFRIDWKYFHPVLCGWELMRYERNGKPVCRYFYPKATPDA